MTPEEFYATMRFRFRMPPHDLVKEYDNWEVEYYAKELGITEFDFLELLMFTTKSNAFRYSPKELVKWKE